jgi:hemoglobin
MEASLTGRLILVERMNRLLPLKGLLRRARDVAHSHLCEYEISSDAVVKNPIVGQKSKNPQLREWHTKNLGRLPGLKFMRTLWVCNVSGGPYQFTATKPGATPLGLEEAHRDLRISPAEFDEVAAELGRTLDVVKVPKREKGEVLAAFAAHKDEVTAGYVAANKRG